MAVTIAPKRSISGPPVTERAAAIAEYVSELEDTYLRVRAELATGDPSHGLSTETLHGLQLLIARQSERYDYYNWVSGLLDA